MTIASHSPRPANNRAKILVVTLFVAAILGFIVSFWIPNYGGTIQLVCLFVLVYALFVASRFLFVSYTYSLYVNDKGVTYFLIEEKQGKRSSLVCQLPLARVLGVKPFSPSAEEARGRYYTYVVTMGGGDYQMVTVEGERGKAAIKIEADAEFLAALRKALSEKQTTAPTEE